MYSATVQKLRNGWHTQEAMRAAIVLPELLVVQAGRIHQNRDNDRTVKCRFAVAPDVSVEVPCFVDGFCPCLSTYHLRAALVHRDFS